MKTFFLILLLNFSYALLSEELALKEETEIVAEEGPSSSSEEAIILTAGDLPKNSNEYIPVEPEIISELKMELKNTKEQLTTIQNESVSLGLKLKNELEATKVQLNILHKENLLNEEKIRALQASTQENFFEPELFDVMHSENPIEQAQIDSCSCPYWHQACETNNILLPDISYPCCERHLTFNAHLLIWKADINNDYALYQTVNQVPVDVSVPLVNGLLGELQTQNFQWRPGIRAELRFGPDNLLWEYAAYYTFYYTSGRHSLTANPSFDPTVVPIINPTFQTGASIVGHLENMNNLHYHVLDLLFAKILPLNDFILFRFFAGGTAAAIKENMHVTLTDIFASRVHHHWSWNFKGGGVKLGIDSSWGIGCGFNALLGSSFSALFGNYKNDYKAVGFFTPGDPDTVPFLVIDDMHLSTGHTFFSSQLLGGLEWNFAIKNFHVVLAALYELNVWFNINQRYLPSFNNQNNFDKHRSLDVSDLNLQGLTLSASVFY